MEICYDVYVYILSFLEQPLCRQHDDLFYD